MVGGYCCLFAHNWSSVTRSRPEAAPFTGLWACGLVCIFLPSCCHSLSDFDVTFFIFIFKLKKKKRLGNFLKNEFPQKMWGPVKMSRGTEIFSPWNIIGLFIRRASPKSYGSPPACPGQDIFSSPSPSSFVLEIFQVSSRVVYLFIYFFTLFRLISCEIET